MALHDHMELGRNKIVQVCYDTLLGGELRCIAFIAGCCHRGSRSFEQGAIDPQFFHNTKLAAEELDIVVMFRDCVPATALTLLGLGTQARELYF